VNSFNKLIKTALTSVYFKFIATGLIVFYLYTLIDSKLLLESLRHINFAYLPFLVLILIVFWVFNIISLYVLLLPLGNITFVEFFHYQFKSTLLGSVTPMEAGEAAIFVYLVKKGFNLQMVLSSFLMNKVIHLILMLITGVVFFYYVKLPFLPSIIFGVICSLILFLLIINSRIRILIRESIVKKYLLSYYPFFELTSDYFRKYSKYLALNIIVNIIKIVLGGLAIWINFQMFSIQVDFLMLLSVFNLSRIVSLIPISIGGIGILEGGVALSLAKIGFDYSSVLLAMFFERFVGIILAAIFLSYYVIAKRDSD
jgi:uncharacterized membrane protein YbhN (UPF0104 family)